MTNNMNPNVTPGISIQLNDDEFFILVAILHQISCNMEQTDCETYHSHADLLFTGNCDSLARTGYRAYHTFRSLTGKVYDTNLKKAVKSTEEWI